MKIKTKKLILLYAPHILLWFILSKLDLSILYFVWGVVMTNWYISIMESSDIKC